MGEYNGELGNGTTEDRFTPVKAMDNVAAISLGESHSAAIQTDDSLWVWGCNGYGQLGDGTRVDRATPVKVMDGVSVVSLGSSHSAVIKSDGSLWMWGENYYGRLGDGTTEDRSTPVKVMDNVAAISLGGLHSAAIKTDASLWMWGDNGFGQLGGGTTKDYSATPVKVMDNVAAVSIGEDHSAAIKTDGSLWMWGRNEEGQLGDGTRSVLSHSIPTKVMDGVATVSLGFWYSAVIKTDGSLWMWGDNGYGRLGDGTTEDRSIPVKVMDNVAAVSIGENHSAAIKTDGSLWMWGGNDYGELGIPGQYNELNQSNHKIQTVPVRLAGLTVRLAVPAIVPTVSAAPTASTVLVDGKHVAFDAYTISGNNYFKLRDLAMALNGSGKQFEVTWDGANNAILLLSGTAYTPVDGELASTGGKAQTANVSFITRPGKATPGEIPAPKKPASLHLHLLSIRRCSSQTDTAILASIRINL